jgi:hypothetical protein
MFEVIVLVAVLLVATYFFLNSDSNYFDQPEEVLNRDSMHLFEVLSNFKISVLKKEAYMKAFRFFQNNPNQFDGATIVKDLQTIKGLDAPAMLHDYQYLHTNFWTRKGFVQKIKYDWQYGENMEELGVSPWAAYTRAVLLIVSTPLYYVYLLTLKL